MSLSVNGSNSNNPLAMWQSLFDQGAAASGNATTGATGTTQSDPLSELLATIGQATGLATGSAGSSSNSTQGTTGSTSPQYGPQTLQALWDMQANASQSSALPSDDGSAASPADPSS